MQEKRAPVRCDTDSSMLIYDLTSSNGSSPSDKHACLNVPRHAVDTSISRCAISVTSTSILISRQAIFPAMPIKTAWTASCNDQSPTFLIRRIRAWSSVTSRANASYVWDTSQPPCHSLHLPTRKKNRTIGSTYLCAEIFHQSTVE